MDDKFRLVFTHWGATPTDARYSEPDVEVFDTLREALIRARQENDGPYQAFIRHGFIVFEPHLVEVLHAQFCTPP